MFAACWTRLRIRSTALLALALLALAGPSGCGGGIGEGGTGSFASGPISGFGSVIVNDIVFDDSVAAVEDGEGELRRNTDLRLGMTVEIEGDALQAGAGTSSARASRIRFDSALLGPVEALDNAGGSFTVLGQRVAVDETTVFEAALAGRLAALRVGDVVEVYAAFDAGASRYRATRVERRAAALAYRVRGVVAQLDPATQTLRIGSAYFAYGAARAVPAGLAAGQFVRLTLLTQAGPLGRWAVLSFGAPLQLIAERDGVVLKGLISRFVSIANFDVDGRAVDASAAQVVGSTAALALGVRVQASGALRAGVLKAGAVTIRSDEIERERGFELRGAIESVNPAQGSFVLRGLTISTLRPGLEYRDGSAAQIAVGRRVEVKGVLAGNGAGIEATRITFE